MKTTQSGLPLLTTEQVEKGLHNSLEKKVGIVLLAIPGSGKTTIFRNWIEKIKSNGNILETPIFITAQQIVSGYEMYGEKYFTKAETSDDICYGMTGRRPLYIDDLGSENSLSYGRGLILNRVIYETIENGGLLYLSSNFSLDQIAEIYGERSVSRLKGSCAIAVLDNPDFRELKQKELVKVFF